MQTTETFPLGPDAAVADTLGASGLLDPLLAPLALDGASVLPPVGGVAGAIIAMLCAVLEVVVVGNIAWGILKKGVVVYLDESRGQRTFIIGLVLIIPAPIGLLWGVGWASVGGYVVSVGTLLGIGKASTGLRHNLERFRRSEAVNVEHADEVEVDGPQQEADVDPYRDDAGGEGYPFRPRFSADALASLPQRGLPAPAEGHEIR